jgi:hypothetical protein
MNQGLEVYQTTIMYICTFSTADLSGIENDSRCGRSILVWQYPRSDMRKAGTAGYIPM